MLNYFEIKLYRNLFQDKLQKNHFQMFLQNEAVDIIKESPLLSLLILKSKFDIFF